MRLRDDELIGLSVENSLGERIGRLVGFIVDSETGLIAQYRVRPRGFIAACLPGLRELLIGHDQVVSIDAKRMVVTNGGVGVAGGGSRRRGTVPSISPQPITSAAEAVDR